MDLLIKNGYVYIDGKYSRGDLLIKDGIVVGAGKNIRRDGVPVFDASNLYIMPGLADIHVHLREPGFSYKETVKRGTMAAAKGGFTLVCAMPNLSPVPDSVAALDREQEIIDRDAVIKVLPYGAITVGEKGEKLSDMEGLADRVFAFSDDGKGVQNPRMMGRAMEKAARLGKAIVAHCEDESLLCGGYVHEGRYTKKRGYKGISSASEYRQVERDLALAESAGVRYHVCHVSTKESVAAIRRAKAKGLAVSGETCPHYLAFTDRDVEDDGRFKMNPPIRGRLDRLALIRGIQDGTIEVITTDHAPHSRREKSKGLAGSSMGVVGLETSFSAVYTYLVRTGYITMEKLTELMSVNPRRLFGLEEGIQIGEKADIAIADPAARYTVDPEKFAGLGRATPFRGKELYGRIVMTVYKGETVWQDGTQRR